VLPLALCGDGEDQGSIGHPENRIADLDQDGRGDELPETVHEQVAGKARRLQELRSGNGGTGAEPVRQRACRDGRGDPHKSGDRQRQSDPRQRQGRGRQEEQQRERNEHPGSDRVDEESANQPWLTADAFGEPGSSCHARSLARDRR